MKIRMLNFLNHEDSWIDFAPVTLIFGPNGGGKSAVLSAVEWAMTGTCRDLPERGAGREVRRVGSVDGVACEVQLFKSGGDAAFAMRAYDPNEGGQLLVAGAPRGQGEEFLWRLVGLTRITSQRGRELMRLCLRAGDLSSWSTKSWQEVVTLLAAGTVPEVLSDLAAHLKARIPENLIGITNEYVNEARLSLNPEKLPNRGAILSAFERNFYAARTEVNRQLKEAKIRAVPEALTPELGAMAEAALIEARNATLDQRSVALTEIMQMQGEIATIQASAELRMRLGEEISRLKREIERCNAALAARPSDDAVEQISASNRAARAALKSAESKLVGVERDLSECVTKVLRELGEKLSKTSRATLSQLEAMSTGEAPLPPEDLEVLREEARRWEKLETDAFATLRAADEASKAIIVAREGLIRAEAQQQAQKDPSVLDMYATSLENWQKKREEADMRLPLIDGEIRRRAMMREGGSPAVKGFEDRARVLETLVEAVRSPEMKAGGGGAIMSALLARLEAECMRLVPELGPLTVSEDCFRLGHKSYATLSESERMRFGCALTAAATSAFKFPWLFVDGVEVLVGPEMRTRFFTWISEIQAKPTYESVVCCAAATLEGAQRFPVPQGWAKFWVEGGRVSKL